MKEDGTKVFYCFDHLRKLKDEILFGVQGAKVCLLDGYVVDISAYIESLRKENQKAKNMGQVIEQEVDPISPPLYRLICKRTWLKGDIFVWAVTVLQWNCMARSINIDNLIFNSHSIGRDSCIIKYFDTKKDKERTKTSPNNCYANPFDPFICLFNAVGCYLCVNDETRKRGRKEKRLLSHGSKEVSASYKYCKALSKIFSGMTETLREYIRPDHANEQNT